MCLTGVVLTLPVTGPAEELSRFRNFVAGSERDKNGTEHTLAIDFNKVTPMPPELLQTVAEDTAYNIYHGNAESVLKQNWVKERDITTVEQLRHFYDMDHTGARATADQWKANIENYGAGSWYQWALENWGTKWNASDSDVTGLGNTLWVTFATAWSFPFPVMRKLVETFPMLRF